MGTRSIAIPDSKIAVVLRLEVTDYERYRLAYYLDVIEGDASREEWNRAPRKATRQELREHFANELDNASYHISDQVPNFNEDGTVEEDGEDDG